MKTKKIKIETLKPNPNNPRTIRDDEFKKLVKSIKDLPKMLEVRPIVVDKDLTVLGGNQRLEAAKAAGLKELTISDISDWSEEEKQEFLIKDNVSFGEWDFDALANTFDQEVLIEWGFKPYNFGAPVDFLDADDDEDDFEEPADGPAIVEKPKITDDGYVRYEVVILETDKKFVVNALNEVRMAKQCSLGEAFVHVFKNYKHEAE